MRKKFFLISVLFFCSAFSRPTTFDDRGKCEKSEGVWREFGNNCIDECETKLDPYPICTDVVISGCECGKSRCWNSEERSCLAISEFKKTFLLKKNEEKKLAAEAKGKREELPKEKPQEILSKVGEQKKEEGKDSTNKTTPPATEKPKEEIQVVKPAQPPSPIISSPPAVPPMFLQQEKAKKEKEKKAQPSQNSPPGLPIIPLPQ
ncbi:MAG: hypothetical protein KGP29_05675 [Proteobacteria bacterium]|nr:hypothetical protein [Pseudomonadota bacterium]